MLFFLLDFGTVVKTSTFQPIIKKLTIVEKTQAYSLSFDFVKWILFIIILFLVFLVLSEFLGEHKRLYFSFLENRLLVAQTAADEQSENFFMLQSLNCNLKSRSLDINAKLNELVDETVNENENLALNLSALVLRSAEIHTTTIVVEKYIT